jgi:hypothetical protein
MRTSRKTGSNIKQHSWVNLFSERGVLLGLLFGLLMLLASESPQLPRETRIPLVQAGTLWVMTLAALCSPASNEARKTLWEGFNPLLLVLRSGVCS